MFPLQFCWIWNIVWLLSNWTETRVQMNESVDDLHAYISLFDDGDDDDNILHSCLPTYIHSFLVRI